MKSLCKIRSRIFDRYSVIIGVLVIFTLNMVFAFVQVRSAGTLDDLRSGILDTVFHVLDTSIDYSTDVKEARLYEDVFGLLTDPVLGDLIATIDDPDFDRAVSRLRHSNDPDSALAVLKEIDRLVDKFEEEKDRSFDILFFLYFSLAVLLLFFLLYSEYENQQSLADERSRRIYDRKLINLLERERNILSLELHDDVAQKLSIIKQHFYRGNEDADHSELLRRYTSDLIDSIRTLAGRLRSPDLAAAGLSEQLELLFSDFRATSGMSFEAQLRGLNPLEPDEERDTHIYRTVQELLSNCRRHSQADSASLSVLYSHPVLKITYRDNGVGYSPGATTDGLGIKGMDYRLSILGGSCRWITSGSDQGGAECRIEIPVTQ